MRLQPEHIDAPPVALFRGYERRLQRKTDQDTVSVLVEIGRSATRVVVARGRSILFIKQIEIGGEQFDSAVADQLDITVPEASALRERILSENRSPSDADDQASADRSDLDWMVHDALRAQVDDLAREIGLCLRYCAVTFRGLRASKITLAGGEANDPTVREVLANHLSLEIRLGNPLKGVDLSAVDLGDDRRTTLADWSVCAGLATFGLFDREALLAAEDRRSGGDDG
jgi:type IV pilus assembly protein PilM